MKAAPPLLLSGLLLCGCLQKQVTSNHGAINLVQAGTPSTWGDSVLSVEKRHGHSLAGITITNNIAGGVTITADRGTLAEGSDQRVVRLTLYDGRVRRSDGTRGSFKEMSFHLVPASKDYSDALTFYQNGEWDMAERKLRAVVEAEPNNLAAQYHLNVLAKEQWERKVKQRDYETEHRSVDIEYTGYREAEKAPARP